MTKFLERMTLVATCLLGGVLVLWALVVKFPSHQVVPIVHAQAAGTGGRQDRSDQPLDALDPIE